MWWWQEIHETYRGVVNLWIGHREIVLKLDELERKMKMSHEEIVAKLNAAVEEGNAIGDRLITIAEEQAATLKEIANNNTDFASLKAAVLAQVEKLEEQNSQTRAALESIAPSEPPANP